MKGYFKYNNKKTTVAGIIFDSKKEAERYAQLKILEKAGKIEDLKMQVKFLIIPKEGKNNRNYYYIADFTYTENGVNVIEDVKSPITKKNPVYRIKRALVLSLFPEYEFREFE